MRRAALKPEGGRPGEKRDATASFRVGGASGLAVLPIRGEGARPGRQVWAEKAQASGDSENGTRGRRAPPQRGLRQVGRRPRVRCPDHQSLRVSSVAYGKQSTEAGPFSPHSPPSSTASLPSLPTPRATQGFSLRQLVKKDINKKPDLKVESLHWSLHFCAV